MYNLFSEFLQGKTRICIIQAENPDGDSLGSALALDYLLPDHEISLYCPVSLPTYLRYFSDWSRVTSEFDFNADGYIIVDTAAKILLSKLLDNPTIRHKLSGSPILVLDHHATEDDLDFPHQGIVQILPACAELIFRIAKDQQLKINQSAAEAIMAGILSDTLGLTSQSVDASTFNTMSELAELGANIATIENRRREFMKKSPRILDYKADLIKRVEYYLNGKLATVKIPWEEIREYSGEYNPNILILEELRMVEGVKLAVAFKTYPDGKLTGKLRSDFNTPICEQIAASFGGGGHPFAAGFRTYDLTYEQAISRIIETWQNLSAQASSAGTETSQNSPTAKNSAKPSTDQPYARPNHA